MRSLQILSLGALLMTGSPVLTLKIASQQAEKPALSERPGLRALAQRRRLILGSAVPVNCLRDNVDEGKFVATTASEFNLIELENELKPPAIWMGPREYKFSDVDFVVGEPEKEGWAQKHKVKLRGHVLIYARDEGYTLPQWIRAKESELSKEQASELLHDYIRAVAGRYKGKIAMWDVVNEAIDDRPNSNPYNLRNSFWFRNWGPNSWCSRSNGPMKQIPKPNSTTTIIR